MKFIEYFDKFFDCLNVDNYTSGRRQRKEFREPYTSQHDSRLEWLQNDFLAYLTAWEESVESRTGFTKKQKKKMLLSSETRLGIKMTGGYNLCFFKLLIIYFFIPQ